VDGYFGGSYYLSHDEVDFPDEVGSGWHGFGHVLWAHDLRG
jgi:hypothetical protein